MPLPPGMNALGPDRGTLEVRTYREGVGQAVGHDLIIDVTGWQANAEVSGEGALIALGLEVDPRSLRVREGLRGVKPLTDKDRTKIRQEIDGKVLHGQPIEFRSTAVKSSHGGLRVDGQLTIAGTSRPASFELELADDRLSGVLPVTQTEFGIKPYRGFMGALKVRDTVELAVDVRLPSSG
ncbi:MAG: YceI family protein [Solirubrobacterales bacterium]|nr:YceI family protein [Solirubrobacterales bacterium]